ncbi:hypothetical protein C5613_36490 [Rhodococcus opacus]|uniref:Uncharacterized protein n=1 Tax=Rhodococcus opacus TaxID=37919 RepID=A0A2S8INP0_RHOOP|nr:hypothetical protein C5613_36490 [Rhodococcus opacus]
MIGYTVPEIRRLLVHLILRYARPDEHAWSWSHWRSTQREDACFVDSDGDHPGDGRQLRRDTCRGNRFRPES